jgi:hypothetical protein
MPLGRWRFDEASGELVEEKSDKPHAEVAAKAERKKREQDERDAHPGNYL